MMAMVPGVLNTSTTAAAAAANEQFVVVDNQLYQLPGVHARHHHDHRAVMNASDLIHHVHHPAAVFRNTQLVMLSPQRAEPVN